VAFAGPTLGWGVLDWIAEYLPSPADPDGPFVLTDEQAEIVLRWYALDEEGEFIHRRAALEMAKGWGKSPLAAAIALAEFAGPVVFDRWEDGEPIGRPWVNPVVEIAAVSEDQTDNTYSALFEMLSANEGRAAKALGIDNGRTRLYLIGRPGVLRPVTAASGSREGARLTFAILDETHLWMRRNGGTKLAGTLRRNAAKMHGRTFETTNAPLLGEKSVAEQSGQEAGIMLHARRPKVEPLPDWPDERMLAALDEVYGDSVWVSRPRLVAEIRDPATSWDDAVRFYFNIRSAGAGRAVDPRLWDKLTVPNGPPPPGTRIAIGFDGSTSRDSTYIRGCTAEGYRFTIAEFHRLTGVALDAWLARHPGKAVWGVDPLEVEAAIHKAFATWNVGKLYGDPAWWRTDLERWAERYGLDVNGDPVVMALDTNSDRRMAPVVDRWLTALRGETTTHDQDERAAEHVRNAHLQRVRLNDPEDDGRTKYRLIKGESGGQIDAAVADALAYEAAMTMPAAAPPKEVLVAWA
jgi:hypothetical protein